MQAQDVLRNILALRCKPGEGKQHGQYHCKADRLFEHFHGKSLFLLDAGSIAPYF